MQQHILSTVKSCFKHTKLTPKTLSVVAQSLYFVALGIRASQLIDYHITPTQASQLIKDLRQNRGCAELLLVQFSDRYTFISHRQRLLEHYSAYSADNGYYVDVQGKTPVKLDKAPEDFDSFITQQLGPFLKSNDTILEIISLPCFMVALTGWLLEYPVVYVCHKVGEVLDEWEPRTNCLGNVSLEWIQLQVVDGQETHPLLSFTYPSQLFLEQGQELMALVRTKFINRLTFMKLNLTQETVSLDRVAL